MNSRACTRNTHISHLLALAAHNQRKNASSRFIVLYLRARARTRYSFTHYYIICIESRTRSRSTWPWLLSLFLASWTIARGVCARVCCRCVRVAVAKRLINCRRTPRTLEVSQRQVCALFINTWIDAPPLDCAFTQKQRAESRQKFRVIELQRGSQWCELFTRWHQVPRETIY